MRIPIYRTELDSNKHNILAEEKSINYNTCEVLNNPQKIADMLNLCFGLNRLAEEHLYMIAMNTKCKALGVFEVSHGSCDCSIVNPREVFIRLLLVGASSFVLAHNHPSGDITPSNGDIAVTNRIKDCSKLMGIELIDHIIVGDSYYSLMENEMM